METERVSFTTEDGIKIVGNYFPGVGERGAVLLHAMPNARDSWGEFALRLQAEGFDVLTIDLRGHGESTITRDGRTIDFKDFSNEEHQDSRYDVMASARFLAKRGIPENSICVGGASIGANLALEFAADNSGSLACFLLSPGTNYRGIEAVPLALRLTSEQAVYIAAADDDRNNSKARADAQEIYDAVRGERELKIFETGGHGTDLLKAHPELSDEIANWLSAAMPSYL